MKKRFLLPSDEKVALFFSQSTGFLLLSRAADHLGLPFKGVTGEQKIMNDVCSDSSKKIAGDTRNNWVTMMFVTKKRYNCFRKQSHIDTCTKAFHDLECFGFQFGDFGFAWNHVHFQVNIPKKYSVEDAEIMLKSHSAKKIFEIHPGFRKRYPNGGFWSGYEYHASTGMMNLEESSQYLQDQQRHHGVTIIPVGQQQLPN